MEKRSFETLHALIQWIKELGQAVGITIAVIYSEPLEFGMQDEPGSLNTYYLPLKQEGGYSVEFAEKASLAEQLVAALEELGIEKAKIAQGGKNLVTVHDHEITVFTLKQ